MKSPLGPCAARCDRSPVAASRQVNKALFAIRHSSFVIILILLLAQPSTIHCQPAPSSWLPKPAAAPVLVTGAKTRPGRVLQLTGEGSFVELPPDIFTNLVAFTV